MKVIQLNIWGGKLGLQIIDFLKTEKPDIVCLQEVNDLPGRSGYKFFSTLDEIRDKSGFKYSAMSASYSSRYMERELMYGNAIVSNLPLEYSQTIFTRGEFKNHFDIEKDDGNIRNLQVARVKSPGGELNILNHHGHHIKNSKLGDDETARQMRIIADEVAKLQGPTVLCGDFNLSPESESIKIIDQKLTNLSVKNGLKNTYNQFGTSSAVCDYIFVNDQVEVTSFKMSNEIVSDHNALILEFELR